MRKFGKLLVLSALLFHGLPSAAQEADTVFLPTAAADSVKSIDLTPREFRELVRQQNRSRRERLDAARFGSGAYVPQHGLYVTLGFSSDIKTWSGVLDWADHDQSNPAYGLLHDKYKESRYGRHCFAALSAVYTYPIARRWEIGAGLSYTGFYNGLWRRADSRKVGSHREYYVSIMPLAVRYSWIYRNRFRLYSGGETGVMLAMRRGFFEEEFSSEVRWTGQFVLLGFTCGRNFFFCGEFGTGCRGILNLGVGWRFDVKNTKR